MVCNCPLKTHVQREWTEDDWSILNIIDTVLTGQTSGEEQMAVQLDRALATSGQHHS